MPERFHRRLVTLGGRSKPWQADVLAVSATISFHVEAVRDLIRAVRQHPVAGRVTILAGGYPYNHDPDLWRKVGADGFAPDAQQAITLADQIVTERAA